MSKTIIPDPENPGQVQFVPDHSQGYLGASLRQRDPAQFAELVEQVYAFVNEKVRVDMPQRNQTMQAVLSEAADRVEIEASRARAAELSRRAMEKEQAEQARRDRLTAADPAVQSEIETFTRVTSANLQLLATSGQLSPEQRVAIEHVMAARAEKALATAIG